MKKEIIEKLSKRSKDLFLIHPITDSRLEKLAELILDNKDEIHSKKLNLKKIIHLLMLVKSGKNLFLRLCLCVQMVLQEIQILMIFL